MRDLDVHLEAIAAGDAEAYALWLIGCEAPIRESLRSFAAKVDTEAVLQEALLRVWQVAAKVVRDGRPNCLLRLGVRIARNLAISETRRLRTQSGDATDLEAHPEGQVEPAPPQDPRLLEHIERCREALPAKPALALSARLESGGAEADATLAARHQMRLNTFLQNFTRARKLLAECLQKKHVDIESEMA